MAISATRKALAALRSAIGIDEVQLVAAFLLIGIGFWDVWRPGGFLMAGCVLLWIALPARVSFITRTFIPPNRRPNKQGEQK